MSRLKRNSQRIMLIMLVCVLCSSVVSAGQETEAVIKKGTYRNEPVEFVELRVKEKQVRLSEKFVNDKDWHKNISLVIRNISDRAIVYLALELEIPKAGTMERPVIVPFVFGRAPHEVGGVSNLPASQRIKPGETEKLTLTPSMKEWITNYLIGHNVAFVSEAKFYIETAVFEDGEAWKNGEIFEQEPGNPLKWRRKKPASISTNSFPVDESKVIASLLKQHPNSVTGTNFFFKKAPVFRPPKSLFRLLDDDLRPPCEYLDRTVYAVCGPTSDGAAYCWTEAQYGYEGATGVQTKGKCTPWTHLVTTAGHPDVQ